MGDSLNFSNDRTTGFGAAGKVSFLKGKPVEALTASTNILNAAEIFPSDKKGFYTILYSEKKLLVKTIVETL